MRVRVRVSVRVRASVWGLVRVTVNACFSARIYVRVDVYEREREREKLSLCWSRPEVQDTCAFMLTSVGYSCAWTHS